MPPASDCLSVGPANLPFIKSQATEEYQILRAVGLQADVPQTENKAMPTDQAEYHGSGYVVCFGLNL